jgi:hypothetical protein
VAFSIYPVLSHNRLWIKINSLNPPAVASIITLQGVTLKTIKLSTLQTEIELEDLPAGLYLIKLYDGEKTTVKKFIRK